MTSPPFFSIVIPTYNRLELLKEALESVWAQTFTDYEVIVVDDGSSDGTWKYMNDNRSRLLALKQDNAGPGSARNLGASKAAGRYLAFLDSDDLWMPWSLEVFSEIVEKHQFPSIVSSKVVKFNCREELQKLKQDATAEYCFPDYFSSASSGLFVGAGMATIKRTEFERVGGFCRSRMNAEDHELIMRLGTSPGFIQVKAPATLAYRCHDGNVTKSINASAVGNEFLVAQELKGAFPGGKKRQLERRKIITLHTRPVSLDCVRNGLNAKAWALYRHTFLWHVQQNRWKYLCGFPLRAVLS